MPVYGRMYFQVSEDQFRLENELKLSPFELDAGNPEFKSRALANPAELFDFDLESYYVAGAYKDLVANIKAVILSRFDLSPVWRFDLLI